MFVLKLSGIQILLSNRHINSVYITFVNSQRENKNSKGDFVLNHGKNIRLKESHIIFLFLAP